MDGDINGFIESYLKFEIKKIILQLVILGTCQPVYEMAEYPNFSKHN